MIFLGIDTSCYTTSVAAVDGDGNIIQHKRRLLSVAEGERGLRQSEAFFKHINNFPDLYKELLSDVDPKEITAVCVSTQPRNMGNSYMPVFFAGRRLAESIAMSLNVPLFSTDHQQGHIAAATYGVEMPKDTFCAVHLSGGTTEVLLVKKTDTEYKTKIIAQTKDINAGQLIDRLGVKMKLSFPSGKEVDKNACLYKGEKIVLPISATYDSCNFSGTETAAIREYENGASVECLSEAIMSAITRTLAKMVGGAAYYAGVSDVLMAGGVSSSEYLRKNLPIYLEKKGMHVNLRFSPVEFSSDNAVGVALLGRNKYIYRGKK